jgi:protein TonB
MLKKDDFTTYLVVSVVIHMVLIAMFIIANRKPDHLFVSVPIDVTFYTPAQKRSDPPPVKVEEKAPAPEPVKEVIPEEPKTKEDVIVKQKEKPKPQAKPKPKPKPKEPPKKEEPKKAETPAPTENVNTVQAPDEVNYEVASSQYEGLSFDTANFKYSYYEGTIVRKIRRYWENVDTYGRMRVVIYFRILKDGTVNSIKVKSPSGDNSFDQTAVRAVQLASPFAPLPDGYSGDSIGVNFEFKWR